MTSKSLCAKLFYAAATVICTLAALEQEGHALTLQKTKTNLVNYQHFKKEAAHRRHQSHAGKSGNHSRLKELSSESCWKEWESE
jgi:hypothetical protein